MHQTAQSDIRCVTTLHDLKLKLEFILLGLSSLFYQIKYCNDFNHVEKPVAAHLNEVLCYINQCIAEIQKHHSQFELAPMPLTELVTLYSSEKNTQTILPSTVTLDSIETQLRQLNIQLDQLVFMIRDCPNLVTRPHVVLLARAMSELFQLQQHYIYPFRADLVPDFLKDIRFVEQDFNHSESWNN